MKKRAITLLTALVLITVLLLTACGTKNGSDAGKTTEIPAGTEQPATNAPAGNTATDVPTAAPTEEPVPTEKDPLSEIDALMVELDDPINYRTSGSKAEMRDGEPFLTITTLPSGDIHSVFMFPDIFSPDDYPFIAFKYRIGYGQSIISSNHFYAITTDDGPTPKDGWWGDISFKKDCDWHTGILEIKKVFKSATGDFMQLRTPNVNDAGGDWAIAWIGAFKSKDDITKYDEEFNKKYGDKLVKAEPPKEEKEEVVPIFEDAFEEISISFDDMTPGDAVTPVDPLGYAPGLNNSTFVERDGGAAVLLNHDALFYPELVRSGAAYTVSFDIRNSDGWNRFGGFVFNWGDEGNSARNFYENNGIAPDGEGSMVSASGCGFAFQGGNQVRVYIPVWDNAAVAKVAADAVITAPVDFDADYVYFVIVDDGAGKVTVSAGGGVLAIIEYSDPGLVDGAPNVFEQYYRTVKVTDAAGSELFTARNAMFSVYKSIAFAGRGHNIYLDNIVIANN